MFSVSLVDEDIYLWEVVINGPKDSPYENGVFKAHLKFPNEYPFRAPTMRFISDPNITSDGRVCFGMNGDSYAQVSGYNLMLSVISLLSEPYTDSLANMVRTKSWGKG
ncbi:unnamed protein product [Oppiella nova]|uniref:UBC core domain-containing protein n=1 Tax=Oppiella nova TaxID=334625 RepID=A0A7R9LV55_9ACAR|nr:unnamed protein product [Oppiella nova]CAG2167236.1 unnamed protein product [Oppiella nova]